MEAMSAVAKHGLIFCSYGCWCVFVEHSKGRREIIENVVKVKAPKTPTSIDPGLRQQLHQDRIDIIVEDLLALPRGEQMEWESSIEGGWLVIKKRKA